MQVIHSTHPRSKSPCRPISMRLTVQLPPMKSLAPASSASSMTRRFTGSRTTTASPRMRRAEAASIQKPFQPASRNAPWTDFV